MLQLFKEHLSLTVSFFIFYATSLVIQFFALLFRNSCSVKTVLPCNSSVLAVKNPKNTF